MHSSARQEEVMRRTPSCLAALAVSSLAFSGAALAGNVNVGIHVGVTPPPVVLAPPPLVVVPGTTQVHHVPTAAFNLFVHRGRYYSFHNGAWFVAAGHRAPWTVIAIDALPAPVRAVPVSHYKVPPGHAKKHEAQEGGWCPPGQAKKGRC
jgi:hypothetical protein